MRADLEALPEQKVGELIGGMLHVSPRPGPAHAFAAAALGGLVVPPFGFGGGGPGGWWILFEPELHFAGDVLVPDLAGWRRERLPRLPKQAALTVAPDWVCEILAPSTNRLDRANKLPIYAAQGVGHLWLVDPLSRTAEVYRRTELGKYLSVVTAAGEAAARLEPFEAVALDLRALWVEVDESEPSG